MPYYDTTLTSIISVDTADGTLDLHPTIRVLLQVGDPYILCGYYTHSNELVYTLPQPIDGNILTELTPTLYDMSGLEIDLEPDDQML